MTMRSKMITMAACAALMVSVGAAHAQDQTGGAGQLGASGMRAPIARPGADLARASIADGFVFVATGDLLGPHRPLTALKDPGLDRVLKIIQDGDVAFANHETSAFDLNGFAGTQAAQNGGGYPRFDPSLVKDFKAMGLDIVSLANNHAGDWGAEGLLATLATLNEAGLVQAGGGASLSQARAPGLFETAKGRVALIATASTFVASTPAADGKGALRPRPGISVLRTTQATTVTPTEMAALRPLAAARDQSATDADQLRLGSTTFKVGDKPGISYTVNQADRQAIIQSITEAKTSNDLVAFSIHAHETDGGADPVVPGDFLPTLFHQAIDAGADIVIRHGPHELGGIEIYKGKPIFYSLASLFFGVGGPERTYMGVRIPESWYDSAIATTEYKGGKASVIRVYPLTITTDRPNTFSAPIPASAVDGKRILEKIQKDSRAFGTDMKIENGVGVIRIAG